MRLHLPADGHLAAHLDDFLIPFDAVQRLVVDAIPDDAPFGVPFCVVVRSSAPVGRTRCVPIDGRRTWWGFRADRALVSHLASGEPEVTNVVTAWLRREGKAEAHLLTVYPGEPAPRETHDPQLTAAERAASHAFWRDHALLAPEPSAFWLVNAISLNMLAGLAEGETAGLRVRRVGLGLAQLLAGPAQSAVGHPDTAALFAGTLGLPVAHARCTLSLEGGECLLAGQYVGERLPPGASELPPGAQILWYWVEVDRPIPSQFAIAPRPPTG